MKMMQKEGIEWVRKRMYPLYKPFIEYFHRRKVHPHQLTAFSLLFGILAFVMLFENMVLFVFFGLIHLFFDGLDGAYARKTGKVTVEGELFDKGTDFFITILLVSKTIFFYSSPIYLIGFGIYILENIIFFGSMLESPVLSFRTMTIFLLALHMYSFLLLLLGIVGTFGLVYQIQYYLGGKK